jgi:hypothetical protein
VEFLLECIGFPPDQDLAELARLARRDGEPVAWRGPQGEHLRLPLGDGLEVRMDREDGSEVWSLSPYFEASQRLRVALEALRFLDDSPYDALVSGRANPPARAHAGAETDESYPLSAVLTDARRLPRKVERGHVLAMALAGFAVDVDFVGPDPGEKAPSIAPLGGTQEPGGCVEVSLRVLRLRELTNPVSASPVQLLEVQAPGRSLPFFLSPWQLRMDGLPAPRPGWRVEGTFLLCGRIAGGLGGPSDSVGRAFG